MIADSLRALRISLKDYLLLLGEPSPLLGTAWLLMVEAIEMLDKVPVEQSAQLFDKLSALILNAAILGVVERLEGLRPVSDEFESLRLGCLQSVKSCLKVTETLRPGDRRDVCFKILGMALKVLGEITGQEYPTLFDAEGQKLLLGEVKL